MFTTELEPVIGAVESGFKPPKDNKNKPKRTLESLFAKGGTDKPPSSYFNPPAIPFEQKQSGLLYTRRLEGIIEPDDNYEPLKGI